MFNNRPAVKSEEKQKHINVIDVQATVLKALEGKIDNIYVVRDFIQQRILSEYDKETNLDETPQIRNVTEQYFNQFLEERNLLLARDVRNQLYNWVLADILGYGPLEPLLNDPNITEIMVNGYKTVYVEKYGKIETTNVRFENDAHLRRIIDRIVSPIGRRVDESSPMVDARLPSGYRVNVTIPPLSLIGSILTIRKFSQDPYTAQDLIANGTFSGQMAIFLKACVEARVNLVISGGTGTGKTTLLNVASAFVPSNERIITIEDTAELQLKQEHVIPLEVRPPNIEGKGEITIRQLVINALRMRPDRIIVGEARGEEALDMLQAMNTGHEGSMTTIHSNSPRDTLRRIETMVMMAGVELSLSAIREQISSAIEIIVHLARLRDGSRRVVKVTEVLGMEGDTIVLQDIYKFVTEGFEGGRVIGKLRPTGIHPSFKEKFDMNMVEYPDGAFDTKAVD